MRNKIIRNKIFKFILYIIIPLGLGTIVGFLSGSNQGYTEINKPFFAPSGIVFPIVWSILYIIMGISAYKISESSSAYRNIALNSYYTQLFVNLLWSFIFFKLKMLLLAALWIILLIYLVIKMIINFNKIDKISSYLQIPYLIWLVFAFILNITIYFIN